MRARRRQRERRRERVSAGDVSHVQHGTWAAYTTEKCRCPACRAFKSAYMKAYRARQRSASCGVMRPDVPWDRDLGTATRVHLRHLLGATFGDTGSAGLCTAHSCTPLSLVPRLSAEQTRGE